MARVLRAALLGGLFSAVLLAGFVAASVFSGGRALVLPVWTVSMIEEALNRHLRQITVPGRPDNTTGVRAAGVSVGAVSLGLDASHRPDLRIADLTLMGPGGTRLVQVPEARLTLSGRALLHGRLALHHVRLDGPRAVVRRDPQGRFELLAGLDTALPDPARLPAGALVDMLDGAMGLGIFAGATVIEAQAISLTIDDRRAGRVWTLGDGRLTLRDTGPDLALTMGFGLVDGGQSPARAVLSLISPHGARDARLSVELDQMAARDLAVQTPLLGWLGLLDAPISGALRARMGPDGTISTLEGRLGLGPGALRPSADVAPLPFRRAGLGFAYDSAENLYRFDGLEIDSDGLRLTAQGSARPIAAPDDAPDGIPAFDIEAQISAFGLSGAGLGPGRDQATPGAGTLALRLTPEPFALDMHRLQLTEPGTRLQASGRLATTANGWQSAADVQISGIDTHRLRSLWPAAIAPPPAQRWMDENLLDGRIEDFTLRYRQIPGQNPDLTANGRFEGISARIIPALPPIEAGTGTLALANGRVDVVLETGQMTAAEGGVADLAGTRLVLGDISMRPIPAQVDLQGTGPIPAALSLLDALPRTVVTRAGLTPRVANGTARLAGPVRFPLVRLVDPWDLDYEVQGTLHDVTSTRLVPERDLAAQTLMVTATPDGVTITGDVTLEGVAATAHWHQPMVPRQPPTLKPRPDPPPIPSHLTATVALGPAFVQAFLPGLPRGAITGSGTGDLEVTLIKDRAPQMRASSDLAGIGLNIPQLGWQMSRTATGQLEIAGSLGREVQIERLALTAPGLAAEGRLTMSATGQLAELQLTQLETGGWLQDARLTMAPTSPGAPLGISMRAGTMRITRLPEGLGQGPGGTAGAGGPIDLQVDDLQIGRGLSLTDVRAQLRGGAAGPAGNFAGRVNAAAPVRGTIGAKDGARTITLVADDAGAVLAAAGLAKGARGGTLDLRLAAQEGAGRYDGRIDMQDVTLRNLPALADLLNAASIVGLIEQMQSGGLVFGTAGADLRIGPDGIEVRNGAAEGSSFGVSLEGLYDTAAQRLNLSGVLSPFYLINAIGRPISRAGEGLFGLIFTVKGPPSAPEVGVNPLSVLAPGMLRDIFRAPAAGLAP